jgi:hypothetical protein
MDEAYQKIQDIPDAQIKVMRNWPYDVFYKDYIAALQLYFVRYYDKNGEEYEVEIKKIIKCD